MRHKKIFSGSLRISLLTITTVLLFSCNGEQKFSGYLTTAGSGTDQFKVVVVKGTPREMGYQLGTLLKDDITECLNTFLTAAQQEAPEAFSNEALDKAWESNAPFIDERVKKEMEGLAEATGIDLQKIRRSHMVPVVGTYSCSGVVVWDKATATGHTYQIRNLDFSKDAGLQDHPVVVVYVPDQGTPQVNVSFAGYIASHTGMNINHLVFGEIGESPRSEFPYDLHGAHFSFLFRQMMYDATSLDDIINNIQTTPLIKRYFLFFSDGRKESQGGVKVLVSTPDSVKYHIWRDNDSTDIDAPNVMPYVVYNTMNNPVAVKMLKEYYGKFDAKKMIELSRAVADEDGNLMDVVYDATTLEMWVAYANGQEDASKQGYVHLSLDDILKEAGLK
jgi:hypothetical protein